ncbi:MAG: cytochrome c oxidase subunit 3 [Candidatus Tectimicrobiota bacterium]|nr:MAG: cytochrome c oxidase subunit 3 [Candidatus Tectomicrobia bacterium]
MTYLRFASTAPPEVRRRPLRVRPQGPPPRVPEPPGGDDWGDHHGDEDAFRPPLSNACLGMLVFLGAETMFFAGLIGTFLVFRVASEAWPPPAMPRLPVGVTGLNTLVLLASAYTMWQAQQAARRGLLRRLLHGLGLTALLGVTFLLVQGYEWMRLLGFGLTLASGVYGATFYTLIGCHALHVCGAVLWLLGVTLRAWRGRMALPSTGLTLCGMYWYYVVGLWPVLYTLVYLA